MVLTKFTWKLLTFFFLCFSIRAIGQGTVAAQFSVDLLAGHLNSDSRKSRLLYGKQRRGQEWIGIRRPADMKDNVCILHSWNFSQAGWLRLSLERKLCNLLATSLSNGSGATLQGLIRDLRTRFAKAFMRTINTTRTVFCPQP
jgi:hypothetical protein